MARRGGWLHDLAPKNEVPPNRTLVNLQFPTSASAANHQLKMGNLGRGVSHLRPVSAPASRSGVGALRTEAIDTNGDGLVSHGELDAYLSKSCSGRKAKEWQLGPYAEKFKPRKHHPAFLTEQARQYTGRGALHDAEGVGMRTEVWANCDACIYQSSAPLARFNYVVAIT